MIPLRSSKIYLENGSVAPTSRQDQMDTLQAATCTRVAGVLENALVACFTGLLGSSRFMFRDLADRKPFLAGVNVIYGRYRYCFCPLCVTKVSLRLRIASWDKDRGADDRRRNGQWYRSRKV